MMNSLKLTSLLCIFCVVGNVGAVQMTPQIQSLLDQKAQKVAELEKCDKTRKGFMIAGISTLGLTAVGIGGNIALANKNKKLDEELTSKKTELGAKKKELSNLQLRQQQAQLTDIAATKSTLDLSKVNIAIDGLGYCYKDIDGAGENNPDNCKKFNNMKSGDWGVVFEGYEVYGKAVCNNTKGDDYAVESATEQTSTPNGVNCWCQMTEPAVSRWVFNYWYSSAPDCADGCARNCGHTVQHGSGFRSAIYGQTHAVANSGEPRLGDACATKDLGKDVASGVYAKNPDGNLTCEGNKRCYCRATKCKNDNYKIYNDTTCMSSIDYCRKTRADNPEGVACCDLKPSVAEWNGTSCVCKAPKTYFEIYQDAGKCVELNPDDDGIGHCYKDIDRDGSENLGKCAKFDTMQAGDWGAVFPGYEVYGVAVCNDTRGSYDVASPVEQTNTGGVNCWCKMTEPAVSRWVFRTSYSSASGCVDGCAAYCGLDVQLDSDFRSGVFGSVQ